MCKKLICLLLLFLLLPLPLLLPTSAEKSYVYTASFGVQNEDEPYNCLNLPTVAEDGSIEYYGGFTPIIYPKGMYSNPANARVMDAQNMNVNNGEIIAASEFGFGGGAAHMRILGPTYGANTTYYAFHGQVCSTGSYSAGIRYTAEKTGVVDIDWDAVGKAIDKSKTIRADEFRYGIFYNGDMIWPVVDGGVSLADTKPLHKLLEGKDAHMSLTEGKFPVKPDGAGCEIYVDIQAVSDLSVTVGDTIDFVCEMVRNDGSWGNIWNGFGQIMFPSIHYTSALETPSVSASISLENGFGVSFNVAKGDAAYRDLFLTLNGETLAPDEEGKYPYDVAAKDIGKKLHFQLWGDLAGKTVLLSEGNASIADLLYDRFVNNHGEGALRNLAIASLNYGAAAQEYFGSSDPLANEKLSPSEKTVALTGTYTDTAIIEQTKENADVVFDSASLLINDTVDLKLVVTSQKSIGNYRMQVSSSADFSNATLVPFMNCQISGYKAILSGIAPGAWDDVIYARVVDTASGNAVVSDTIRYSAAIYYARMKDDASLANMLRAMLDVNEAAAAYAARP